MASRKAFLVRNLEDVEALFPDNGDALTWVAASGKWMPIAVSGGGGLADFLSLSDTPATYATASGKYVRVTDTEDGLIFSISPGGAEELDDLTDVTILSPTAEQMLYYNAVSGWTNEAVPLDYLGDVVITEPQESEFLQYDSSTGKWINHSAMVASDYFLQRTDSDISTYHKLVTNPVAGVEIENSVNVAAASGIMLIKAFATDEEFSTTLLEGGSWHFVTWAKVDSAAGDTNIVVKIYEREAGGTENLIATVVTDDINGTSLNEIEDDIYIADTLVADDSRLVIKYFAQTTSTPSRVVSLAHDGQVHYTHIHTPFTISSTATPTDFTDLSDTPSSYSGQGGLAVAVKGTEDGLEFVAFSGGSGGGTTASRSVMATGQSVVADTHGTDSTWENIVACSGFIALEEEGDIELEFLSTVKMNNTSWEYVHLRFELDTPSGTIATPTYRKQLSSGSNTARYYILPIYYVFSGMAAGSYTGRAMWHDGGSGLDVIFYERQMSIKGTWDVTAGGGGASAFTDLSDVPSSYSGQAGKSTVVNDGEDALEFVTVSGGGGGHTIQDEGVDQTQRTNLNFVGSAVTILDDSVNDATKVVIDLASGILSQEVYETLTAQVVSGISHFNLSDEIVDDSLRVYFNGIRQQSNYFAVDSDNEGFTTAFVVQVGDEIFVDYEITTSGVGILDAYFTSLLDTPTVYAAASGKYVRVSDVEDALIFDTPAGGGGGQPSYVHVIDKKDNGTAGGTFTQAAWRTRDLTEEVTDDDSVCSLSSNQITLDSGTYQCRITAPAFRCEKHMARLYNITDSVVELLGTAEWIETAGGSITKSHIIGQIAISGAAQKVFEVQHYCTVSKADNGFGVDSTFADNIYTVVELWKTA